MAPKVFNCSICKAEYTDTLVAGRCCAAEKFDRREARRLQRERNTQWDAGAKQHQNVQNRFDDMMLGNE